MSTEMQTKVQVSPAQSFIPVQTGLLQKKSALCNTPGLVEDSEQDKQKLTLQRSHNEPSTVPPIVDEVLQSPGQPLDPATRTYMEPRFGHDFSKVRVHTDAKATESAQAVGAIAYTVGPHIVFMKGQYTPGTSIGRRLIAHELTHVIQQSPFLSRQVKEVKSNESNKNISASQRLSNLASLLEHYTNRADMQLASSGVSDDVKASIRSSDLTDLRVGIEKMRQVAGESDEKTCTAILSGFTPARLKEASQYLVPAQTQQFVTVAKQQSYTLAPKSLIVDLPYSAAEAEADRVADAVLSEEPVAISLGVQQLSLQRFLDTQAAAQLAATAATLKTTGVAGAAIAAGSGPPGWVIGLAIVTVVAIVAAGGYLYYQSREAKPQIAPTLEPESTPAPMPQPEPSHIELESKRRRRNPCHEAPIGYHRGGDPIHNTCADLHPAINNVHLGSDYRIQTPQGQTKHFDALSLDGTLWEVKTQTGSTASRPFLRRITVSKYESEAEIEKTIANACGHPFKFAIADAQLYQEALSKLRALGVTVIHVPECLGVPEE